MEQFQFFENDSNETTTEQEIELFQQQQTTTLLCPQAMDQTSPAPLPNSMIVVSTFDDAVIDKGTLDSSTGISKITDKNLQATKKTTEQLQNDFPIETQELASTSASAISAMNAVRTADATAAAVVGLSSPTLECPICLQSCIHPARLPCGHIFCFLCVKGVASKNRRCAMCRREISVEFLEHPHLINGIKDIRSTKTTADGYQWFYEGRNGWWQYDDRTSQDIEESFKKGEKSCIILVAGYVYIVDLENMIQQRQNEPARCRRVKRDLATIPKKGVAGLRIEGDIVTAESSFAASFPLPAHGVTYSPQTNLAHAVYARHPHGRLQHMNMHTHTHMLHDFDTDEEDNDLSNISFVGFNIPMLDYDNEDDEDDDDEFGVSVRSTLSSIDNHTHDLSEIMPNLVPTNDAISIVNDIIESTLATTAHTNDAQSRLSTPASRTDPSTDSTLQLSTTTNHPTRAQYTHGEHASNSFALNHSSYNNNINSNNINNTLGHIINDLSMSSSVSAVIHNNTIGDNLGVGQQNIAQADSTVAVANNRNTDLFEQTLNNLQALNLHDIDNSGDEVVSSSNVNQTKDQQTLQAHTRKFQK